MSLEVIFFGKLGSGLRFTKETKYKVKQGVLKDVFDFYKRKNLPERSMGKSYLTYEEIRLANSTLSLSELISFMKDFNIVPALLTINGLNFAWQRQRQKCNEYLFKSNRIDYPNFIEILARCAVLAYINTFDSHAQRAKQLVKYLNLENEKFIRERLLQLHQDMEKQTKPRTFIKQVKRVFRVRHKSSKYRIRCLYHSFKSELASFEKQHFRRNARLERGATVSCSVYRIKRQLGKAHSFHIGDQQEISQARFRCRKSKQKKQRLVPAHAKLSFLSGSIDAQFSKEALNVFLSYSNAEKVPEFPWRQLVFPANHLDLQIVTRRKYTLKLVVKNLFDCSIFLDYRLEKLNGVSIDFDGLARIKGLVSAANVQIKYVCSCSETGFIVVCPKKREVNGKLICLKEFRIQVTISARDSKVTELDILAGHK